MPNVLEMLAVPAGVRIPFRARRAPCALQKSKAGNMTESEDFSAEAEASSVDPHDWGRAMALAVTRLAEQLAPGDSEDIHAALVGRDLCLTITDGDEGVIIKVSTAPGTA